MAVVDKYYNSHVLLSLILLLTKIVEDKMKLCWWYSCESKQQVWGLCGSVSCSLWQLAWRHDVSSSCCRNNRVVVCLFHCCSCLFCCGCYTSIVHIHTVLVTVFAPYTLRGGNAPWFMCWFQCYINCLCVYLTSFLTSFFTFVFPYAFILTWLLPDFFIYSFQKGGQGWG